MGYVGIARLQLLLGLLTFDICVLSFWAICLLFLWGYFILVFHISFSGGVVCVSEGVYRTIFGRFGYLTHNIRLLGERRREEGIMIGVR